MYLVTGATGNVGSNIVDQLLINGKKVRVFTRDPGKVAHWGARIEVVIGDFEKQDTFVTAFAGVEAAFLMNRGTDGGSFQQLIAAAKAQGHPGIVFLSTILAGSPEFTVGKLHKDKEDAIRESGLPGKFIRPGAFMTNSYQWIGTIKSEGVVYNPTGMGKSALIAPSDIAAVAVKALTDPDLPGEVFELTGSESLSAPEQVSILADALGKPIRCVDVPMETAVQGLIRTGIPPQMAAAVAQSLEAIRDGRSATIKDTVERVTGNKPKTFKTWAHEHASRFA